MKRKLKRRRRRRGTKRVDVCSACEAHERRCAVVSDVVKHGALEQFVTFVMNQRRCACRRRLAPQHEIREHKHVPSLPL